MPVDTVRAEWVSGSLFKLSDRHGYSIEMTQPDGVKGSDLLPLSVIGCAAWDILSILRKQRQPVSGFQVSAESEQAGDPPWAFKKIHIHYQFQGSGLNREMIRRAIDLTESGYCSTFATLKPVVEITSTFEIQE